jgi:hypothetical protein
MLMRPGPPQGSRQKLEVAMKALETQNVYEPDTAIYQNALNIIRSSSMNCYSFQACLPPCVDRFMCMHAKQQLQAAAHGPPLKLLSVERAGSQG